MTLQCFPFAAVLTGDFVGSRRDADALVQAMQVLRGFVADLPDDLHMTPVFDRYRGDGWQVLLPEAQPGLRVALRIIAALKRDAALPTRIALGFGPAQLPSDHDLGAASGPAFLDAGDALSGMDRQQRLAIPRASDPAQSAYGALVAFLDHESQGWTRGQAEALDKALRLSAPTQDEIATSLGVTRQAVQSRLSGTALAAITAALHAFESRLDAIFDAGTKT